MAETPTLYHSPAIRESDGTVRVLFAPEHPGFRDRRYQEHRATIARSALEHVPGTPPADVAYTAQEHNIWRLVSAELGTAHEQYACAEYLDAVSDLKLPRDRVPQLSEVSATLERLTGFGFTPAAGLVDARRFYGSLDGRVFNATQYIRHHSTPRFSSEPDMVHEIFGHGGALASPRWADIYELVGRAIRRLETAAAVDLVSRVFWFTLECGLVRQGRGLRVFGASLLSSGGEMEQFGRVEIRPLDLESMATQPYRPDAYQAVLYCADSFAHMEDFLAGFLTSVQDWNLAGSGPASR